jgi:hypothetical protein
VAISEELRTLLCVLETSARLAERIAGGSGNCRFGDVRALFAEGTAELATDALTDRAMDDQLRSINVVFDGMQVLLDDLRGSHHDEAGNRIQAAMTLCCQFDTPDGQPVIRDHDPCWNSDWLKPSSS